MMNIRLTSIGLILTSLIYYNSAQHAICNSLEGYDTKFLVNAVQWRVTTDYQCLGHLAANCTYFISFCQKAPNCFNEYSACQNSSASTNVTVLGAVSTSVFYENEPGQKGFYALFPKGPMQNVSNTTTCEPSLKLKFNCNREAHWFAPIGDDTANAPQPTDIDVDDNCLTVMTFDFPGACAHGEEPEKGMSGGAIFLLIVFCTLVTYFIVGIGYNGLVKHQSGINLIPNAEFWVGLPLHAITGCRTILGFCSGSSKPSQATYESV
ncbi:hypothetical protein I4U23_013783 [Adineta vaga]|nr:hypothetical protein I4U23_013783 [Adineta vaga]